MLVLRCPAHPDYEGTTRPEGRVCADCWEVFRRAHDDADRDPRWGHPTFPS